MIFPLLTFLNEDSELGLRRFAWNAVVFVFLLLAVRAGGAETGHDAWLRYSAAFSNPAAFRPTMIGVIVFGESPVLRAGRDQELRRGFLGMLAVPGSFRRKRHFFSRSGRQQAVVIVLEP